METPATADLPERTRKLLTHPHPHNAPLEVWFELGVVGTVLAAALILFAFRAIGRLPIDRLGAATATVTAVFTVSTVSHGAWQSWWFCLIGLVAATYAMLPRLSEDDNLRRISRLS